MGTLCIDHINIVVRNELDLMRDFYSEIIGMKVFKTSSLTGSWVDNVAGLDNVKAEVVFLELNSFETKLELIKYHNPSGSAPIMRHKPNTVGIRHIAFRVSDIDEVVDKCLKHDVEFQSGIQKVPMGQVKFNQEGAVMTKKICYFFDPENNLLEFCSYNNAKE